jgi:hypothetical protein
MSRLREALHPENREYTLVLALALLIGALALVGVLRPAAQRAPIAHRPASAISPPGPVIGTRPIPSPAPAPTAAQLEAANLAARRFLSAYLPYIYGHTRARDVPDAAPLLRATLARDPLRITPAQRKRHPRLLALDVEPRGAEVALATATIADGAGAPYPIHLALTDAGGRWLVERVVP